MTLLRINLYKYSTWMLLRYILVFLTTLSFLSLVNIDDAYAQTSTKEKTDRAIVLTPEEHTYDKNE